MKNYLLLALLAASLASCSRDVTTENRASSPSASEFNRQTAEGLKETADDSTAKRR